MIAENIRFYNINRWQVIDVEILNVHRILSLISHKELSVIAMIITAYNYDWNLK